MLSNWSHQVSGQKAAQILQPACARLDLWAQPPAQHPPLLHANSTICNDWNLLLSTWVTSCPACLIFSHHCLLSLYFTLVFLLSLSLIPLHSYTFGPLWLLKRQFILYSKYKTLLLWNYCIIWVAWVKNRKNILGVFVKTTSVRSSLSGDLGSDQQTTMRTCRTPPQHK